MQEDILKPLETEINGICTNAGFPGREEFKWSPNRDSWMWNNLAEEARKNFFISILQKAKDRNVKALVIIEDTQRRPATTGTPSAEIDVIRMFFERIDWELCRNRKEGIIITDRPGGGRAEENRFLFDCIETIQQGTEYMKLDKIALNPLSTDSQFSRLLQLSDLITSCTLAHVAGEIQHSPIIFRKIRELLCRDSGRIGGIGLKIHPDYRYCNLYHWLLHDSHFYKRNMGIPLPIENRPYAADPNIV